MEYRISDDEYLNKDLNRFAAYMEERYGLELSDELMDLFFNDWYYKRLNEEEVLEWMKGS